VNAFDERLRKRLKVNEKEKEKNDETNSTRIFENVDRDRVGYRRRLRRVVENGASAKRRDADG